MAGNRITREVAEVPAAAVMSAKVAVDDANAAHSHVA